MLALYQRCSENYSESSLCVGLSLLLFVALNKSRNKQRRGKKTKYTKKTKNNTRGNSFYTQVTIIKSLLLPKMLYVFSVLTTPGEFIKQLNTIIYNFLWKGTDKIARKAAVNDLKYGGLNLIDLETYVKSSRLAWLNRIFSGGSSPWKAYIKYLLEDFGGFFYLVVITMSKTVKLLLLFIENFSNGGLT